MLKQKNYLMAIPVAGIATLNIAAPVFAANQIVVKHPYQPIKVVFSIAAIEYFVQTGDTNGLPEIFLTLINSNGDTLNPEEIRNQFKRPISIDPNLPLEPKSLAKNLLNMLIPPNSPEAERKAALTLMAAKGNGQILIDFLKAIPGETITPDNFLQILTTYQVPAIKPSSAIFNVASDFSLTNNPNGAWRYGWSSSLGSSFNLYSNVGKQTPTIDLWYDSTKKIGAPFVVYNSTATPNNSHPTITYQPGQLGFHPGYYGEYSIVRWIAPEAGEYSLNTTFMGLDHVGLTTTDVHVLHNNNLLFSNLINGFGASSAKSFTTTGTVQAGDTIDFAVGYGSNKTYSYDSTGLDVTISTTPASVSKTVPEPSTVLGLGGLAFSAFIRKMRMKRQRQQQNFD